MRKITARLTCLNCGRTFVYECSDAIMPKDLQILRHPLCLKCRIINAVKPKANRGPGRI
jgi:hypothetical protein